MSTISNFLKHNKKIKENVKHVASQNFLDENGNPLEWEIQPLKTAVDNELRDESMVTMPHPTTPNVYTPQLQTKTYLPKMIAASVVFPDLLNAELQNSYDVTKPEDLVLELLDNAGEFNEFALFIQEYNGHNQPLQEKIEEVKN